MDERDLPKRSGGPVTRSRLGRDLAALGLGDGDVVMFHTRMSALGYVAGGPDTVIGALLDVTWPQDWQDALRAEHPAYDPALSEADHNNGRLPETLRRRPGAVRSRHPDTSCAALGAAAAELMADHPWDDPHGPGSPLARLTAHGGRVLLLGAPLDTMTLLHHAESLAQAPGKRFVDYEQPVLVEGRRVRRRFHDIDSEDGAFDYSAVVPEGKEPFEAIAEDMLSAGLGRQGRVGAAESHLFEAAEVVEFGISWIENQRNR